VRIDYITYLPENGQKSEPSGHFLDEIAESAFVSGPDTLRLVGFIQAQEIIAYVIIRMSTNFNNRFINFVLSLFARREFLSCRLDQSSVRAAHSAV
jgi:hypothetical protein